IGLPLRQQRRTPRQASGRTGLHHHGQAPAADRRHRRERSVSGKKDPKAVEGITLYQRGRKWWFRLTTGRNILTDAPEYEYSGGSADAAEAFAAALKAKEQHDQGRRVKPSNITVGQFFDEWMTSIKGSVKPSTWASYSDYQAWIKPTVWKKKLQKVDVP